MSKAFPNARYLWLTRRDKARQAISLQIALSTREWWAIDRVAPNTSERKSVDSEFDPQALVRTEAALAWDDTKWHSFFQGTGIVPFVIDYEDLVADYPGTIRSVLKWLGSPDADAVVHVR
jgi:LPS sulfotransferase NodH